MSNPEFELHYAQAEAAPAEGLPADFFQGAGAGELPQREPSGARGSAPARPHVGSGPEAGEAPAAGPIPKVGNAELLLRFTLEQS